MNDISPDLRTLVDWAARVEAGQPPQELRDWLAGCQGRAGAESRARWTTLVEARRRLACGESPLDEPTLAPDLVARYLDGQTDDRETRLVEATCWQSPADLCEVVSGLTFSLTAAPPGRNGHASRPATPGFDQRLKSLVGDATSPATVESTSTPATAKPTVDFATSSAERRRPFGSSRYGRGRARGSWPNWFAPVLAAVALVVILIGVFRVLDFLSQTAEDPGTIASPGDAPVSPPPSPAPPQDASPESRQTEPRHEPRREKPAPHIAEANPRRSEQPPDSVAEGVATVGPANDRPIDRPTSPIDPRVDSPPVPPTRTATELAVHVDSATGALLVQTDVGGAWRVGAGRQALPDVLRLVSLAESWSTVEFPGLGSLILAGDTDVELRRGADQVVEVALHRGRIGVRDLPARSDVRVVTDDGRWTVRGRADYSTLGIVRGLESSEVFVAAGIIAIDSVPVAKDQFAPLGDTIAPASLASRAPLVGPLDDADGRGLDWLRAPDDRQRQQWYAANGKLIEQLAAADDAGAELIKLRAATKTGRHAALLARWSLAVSDAPAREVWNMLSDREDAVRDAGLSYLYEIPFRDRRARLLFAEFSEHVDAIVARRMVEWVMSWQRGQTLYAPRAVELVDALGHEELAVRQVAISVLERHTRQVFAASGRKPPPYEADASVNKRAAAQAQWRLLIRQIFAVK